MRIFNQDGSEAEMCGNGFRCLLHFAQTLGFNKGKYQVETMKERLQGSCSQEEGLAVVSMKLSNKMDWDIPLNLGSRKGIEKGIEKEVKSKKENEALWHFLDTGVPHAVTFVEDLEKCNIPQLGKLVCHHKYFSPNGTNVNFVKLGDNSNIFVRTYERGVEAETLACGTGVTASALASARLFDLPSPINVRVKSGEVLSVAFQKNQKSKKNQREFFDISLTGSVKRVFSGTIEL